VNEDREYLRKGIVVLSNWCREHNLPLEWLGFVVSAELKSDDKIMLCFEIPLPKWGKFKFHITPEGKVQDTSNFLETWDRNWELEELDPNLEDKNDNRFLH
jgi:hypothetical protein